MSSDGKFGDYFTGLCPWDNFPTWPLVSSLTKWIISLCLWISSKSATSRDYIETPYSMSWAFDKIKVSFQGRLGDWYGYIWMWYNVFRVGHRKCRGTTLHNVLCMARVLSSSGDKVSALASIFGAWFDRKNNFQSAEFNPECCEAFLFLLIAACLSPPYPSSSFLLLSLSLSVDWQ